MLCLEAHHLQEVKELNRKLRWTAAVIEYEADAPHRHVILWDLKLEDAKTVTNPLGPQEHWCLQGEGELPGVAKATKIRVVVTCLNYLATDRPDTQ